MLCVSFPTIPTLNHTHRTILEPRSPARDGVCVWLGEAGFFPLFIFFSGTFVKGVGSQLKLMNFFCQKERGSKFGHMLPNRQCEWSQPVRKIRTYSRVAGVGDRLSLTSAHQANWYPPPEYSNPRPVADSTIGLFLSTPPLFSLLLKTTFCHLVWEEALRLPWPRPWSVKTGPKTVKEEGTSQRGSLTLGLTTSSSTLYTRIWDLYPTIWKESEFITPMALLGPYHSLALGERLSALKDFPQEAGTLSREPQGLSTCQNSHVWVPAPGRTIAWLS